MASPHRNRAATASPAARTPRSDNAYSRKSHNSPYRHSPRRSEILAEEISTLHIQEERAWRQLQDERDAEQQRLHQQALAQAAAEHDRIFRNALEAAEIEVLKLERERKQKEDEEHRALEAERSAKAAREAADRQRRKEELDRQEQEQLKRTAEEKEIREKQDRLAEQKRKEDSDALQRKQAQEAAERKAKEATDAAAAAAATRAAAQPAQAIQDPTPVANGQSQTLPNPTVQAAMAPVTQSASEPATQVAISSTTPTSGTAAGGDSSLKSTSAQLQALHEQYLAIHQRLKAMRQDLVSKCSGKNAAYGLKIGDHRRNLKMIMGQLTIDKISNRAVIKRALNAIVEIQKYPEPTIDITPFLAIPQDNVERRMPAPLVYMINIVAKSALNQFCTDNQETVDAVAILVATVFSKSEFLYNGTTSLIDILLAKYHRMCPVLFGIYGDEKTPAGKLRTGWQLQGNGRLIDEEHHKKRMTGLGQGYGFLSLRDFSKSKMQNPYPPTNYWRALSYFANTPPEQIQPTHYVVLRGLVESHVEKFVKYFGHAAVVALRKVLVELPKKAPAEALKDTVEILPYSIQMTRHLTL